MTGDVSCHINKAEIRLPFTKSRCASNDIGKEFNPVCLISVAIERSGDRRADKITNR